jgi:disulfide bond formation protein DsbB
MISLFKHPAHSALYWWLLILISLSFESMALYYQYVLDYGPCPLCIHVRIGVAGLILVSILALVHKNMFWQRVCHLLNGALLVWLIERSYLLLGTERGFVYIECGVDSGLPTWLPLDQWFPLLFKVWESCGYTPLLAMNISMADAMIVLFPLMLVITLVVLAMTFYKN